MRTLACAFFLCCALAPGLVAAHAVQHDVAVGEAVVVTLRYADGTPFAYEEAEVRAAGSSTVDFVTRSDGQGRVVFVPDGDGPWVVRVFSADGHGAEVQVDAATLRRTSVPVVTSSPMTGLARIGLGVLLVLGLFFLLARIARSQRSVGGQDHA